MQGVNSFNCGLGVSVWFAPFFLRAKQLRNATVTLKERVLRRVKTGVCATFFHLASLLCCKKREHEHAAPNTQYCFCIPLVPIKESSRKKVSFKAFIWHLPLPSARRRQQARCRPCKLKPAI